jgi:VIT family protein
VGRLKTERTDSGVRFPKGVLEPIERISEVLFGLIMVLTFTASLQIPEATRRDVRTMLLGALGCNLAWGVIDAVFYLMGCLAERGHNLATYQALRRTSDREVARRLISGALPLLIASILEPPELDLMRRRLEQLPEPPERARLSGRDWLGASGVFLLVFLATFPVVIPFLFLRDPAIALRTSNAIAIGMLFVAGVAYGRWIGRSPWVIGMAMVVVGGASVGLTILLGG